MKRERLSLPEKITSSEKEVGFPGNLWIRTCPGIEILLVGIYLVHN